MNRWILRSLMFVPGHNEALLEKASCSRADVLLLDLEDSVQPESNKERARELIREWALSGKLARFGVFPRVNDRESGHLLKDVTALTVEGVNGFVYPKARTGRDIYFFDKLLETLEYEKGFPLGTFRILPLIETASAVLHALEICQASRRVIAVAFGCEDFLTDLEGIHDPDGLSISTPRALIAMAARAAGVIPIDTVHVQVHDLEDLERNLAFAKKLGYEGMLVLNPKEIDLVHQYFTPSEQEYEDALVMLRLYEESKGNNQGVAVKQGRFIGPPMVAAARKTIERYRRIRDRESGSP